MAVDNITGIIGTFDFIVHSIIDIFVNLERESECLLRQYSLADKNAGSKRTYIQQKGAMITKRFGTTDQGEEKL